MSSVCIDLKELFGIKDLADNIKEVKKDLRNALRTGGDEVHTFTVQKPFCCGPRQLVMQALEPYGVKILSLGPDERVNISVTNYAQLAKIELKRMENLRYGPMAVMWLPMAMQCTVTVKKSQAEWAEYLIERSKRMCVVGGRINSKNRDWANAHDGQMPRPWVEKSCSEGNSLWSQVSSIKQEQENEQNAKRK